MSFSNKSLNLVLRFVYDTVYSFGSETEIISYYGIVIIVTSIIFKLLILPLPQSFKESTFTEKIQEIQAKMR